MQSSSESKNFIQEIIENDLKTNKHESIHTRFPPEPNGFLHIGHAKAICLNFELAEKYKGKCNLRFDDTNPEKESKEYMESIKSDISWLGFKWDNLCYSSDYFDTLYNMAVELIKKGFAYVDSQTGEQIRENRGNLTVSGVESPYRDRSIEENLSLFEKMKRGEFADGEVVLRAKIDMRSPNMNLRDPIIYRIKRACHYRTADKWCIYPMYDFTHGQSDMIEGITHSLCTLEFEDHRPLYEWFLDKLDTSCAPRQIEFSRLELEYTILSKRNLIELVDNNFVDGWDDPRMPTISGMRRRGVPASVVRDFCRNIGITKSDALIEIGFFESLLRNELNITSQRRMAVVDSLKITISNYPEEKSEKISIANHPQNKDMGVREVSFSNTLYIEKDDFREEANKKFKRLKLGGEVRLRGAYIIRCDDIIKDKENNLIELICSYVPDTIGKNPEDGRKVKGVIHWVDAKTAKTASIINYDRLFTIQNPMQAESLSDVFNENSKSINENALIESSLSSCSIGEVFQFERIGYFTVDKNSTKSNLFFNKTIGLRDSWQN